ncbi:MAG TPA: HAD family phosphatase [Anaerovoracaceae bacterium]|nr:HAD family phosphatase [Anaerovoracaceae bacterium]
MIKGIVFDMDGLMFDTERLSAEGWAFAGKQMGLDITENIIVKALGLSIENTKRVFLNELGEAFDFSAARKIKVDYMTSYIENNGLPMKTGLIELLDYLTVNHFKITVATSTERERAQYYFDKAGISKFFDKIVCGDMIERGKPEPDIYLTASGIIGVDPYECLALEDSPMGILSAYRAGMKPVMIPDLLQPDEGTNRLLYARLPTLLDVIELLSIQNKNA